MQPTTSPAPDPIDELARERGWHDLGPSDLLGGRLLHASDRTVRIAVAAPPGVSAEDPRLRALLDVRHASLVAVQEVASTTAGIVVVLDDAPGVRLDRLVRARGTLPTGEVVTLGRRVAQGLAALHGAGVRQGGLDRRDVVIAPDGSVRLVPRLGAGEQDARDVADLAGMLAACLAVGSRADAGGSAADDRVRLRRVLAAARSTSAPEPAAGTFAAQVASCAEAVDVALPDDLSVQEETLRAPRATRPPVRPSRRAAEAAPALATGGAGAATRRRTGRVGLLVALSVVAVAVAAVAVVVGPGRPAPGQVVAERPAETASPGSTASARSALHDVNDPVGAARALTAMQVGSANHADAGGQAVRAEALVVPGSPAAAQVVDDGPVARGATVSVSGARLVPGGAPSADPPETGPSGTAARVLVTYEISAHVRVVDGADVPVEASGKLAATLSLEWDDEAGWRVAQVE